MYIRQSVQDNVDSKFVFEVTKSTIAFFQKSYGQRYPFSKVDHLMAPDYKYGAMENVGCITYNDGRLCESKDKSLPLQTWFCTVIQHELCHMWFGNLVTMKWWNDLWLNEAFATCLAWKACTMAGGEYVDKYKDEAFLDGCRYKAWGLREDMLPSNDKIQADCPSTNKAESLINGIT